MNVIRQVKNVASDVFVQDAWARGQALSSHGWVYSIANGLGLGVIAWAVLHLISGNFRKQDWLLYTLAALFLFRFIYLGAG